MQGRPFLTWHAYRNTLGAALLGILQCHLALGARRHGTGCPPAGHGAVHAAALFAAAQGPHLAVLVERPPGVAGQGGREALWAAELRVVVEGVVRRALGVSAVLTLAHADPSLALALHADFGTPAAAVREEIAIVLTQPLSPRRCEDDGDGEDGDDSEERGGGRRT